MPNRRAFRPSTLDGLEVRLALSHVAPVEHVNVEVMPASSLVYEFPSAAAEAKFEQIHPQFQRSHPNILLINDGGTGMGRVKIDHISWNTPPAKTKA